MQAKGPYGSDVRDTRAFSNSDFAGFFFVLSFGRDETSMVKFIEIEKQSISITFKKLHKCKKRVSRPYIYNNWEKMQECNLDILPDSFKIKENKFETFLTIDGISMIDLDEIVPFKARPREKFV